nr:unnamed protein product [Callosobruchus chinensis]
MEKETRNENRKAVYSRLRLLASSCTYWKIDTLLEKFENPNRIANAFGEYLSTVIDDKMKAYFHVLSDSCSSNKVPAPHSMFFNPVLPNEVFTVITALPNKKSTGPDEVPVYVIKANVDILSPKLAELINTSVMSGTFPKALKLASTLVIFKKGMP